MKKYLTLLLISILALGLLSCSQSKHESMSDADKESLSGNVDPTDESRWSFDGEEKPSKEKSNTSDKKTGQEKVGKN